MNVDERQTALARIYALIGERRLDEADAFAQQLIERNRDDADALFLLGIVQAEQKRFIDAKNNIVRAIELDADPHWTRRLALCNVLRDAGEVFAAERAARQLIEREPARAQPWNALGLALQDQRRDDEALAAFRRAIAIDAKYAAAYLNAARCLEARGNVAEAISLLEQALSRDSRNTQLALAMGALLERDKRPGDAKKWYLDVARTDPNAAREAYRRLARVLYAEADIFSAIAAYEESVKRGGAMADVWNLLGNAYMDVAAITNATRCYRAALSIDPGYAQIFDNLLLCHHYDPAIDADKMFDAHKEWARRFAPGSAAKKRPRRSIAAGERMRLAFVSQSLCSGPTGFFLLPLFRYLDTARFETVCYHAGVKQDAITAELRERAHDWRDVASDDDERLADRIGADRIDVLIDLAGHAPGNRLRAIARADAPVIVSWLDYFNTTGLQSVDFLIGDSASIPFDTSQRFTETLIRIEPSRLCYAPPAYAPPPSPPPIARNGFVTFGSFNRLAKLAEPVVDSWARLLAAVPASRLLLKSAAFNHPATRRIFATRFAQRGIANERLELRGSSTHAQMLAEYADIDIALDPFPYNGGLTTCEALWMGVPVVALLGDSMISRQSAALLSAAGQRQWIAKSNDEWLSIASDLASDPWRLSQIRTSLRDTVSASPLVDGARFAARFAAALEEIWSERAQRPR